MGERLIFFIFKLEIKGGKFIISTKKMWVYHLKYNIIEISFFDVKIIA